jgi:probable biosynthetic protein (TIGR04098 family)
MTRSALAIASASLPSSVLRIGMPHMNAGGLSESWLFRHAGDRHWQAIGARWGLSTDELRSQSGARLYPTFLAVRATYGAPLSTVRENDDAVTHAALSWMARGYAHGSVTVTIGDARLRLEMLTMLAERTSSGRLRAAQAASHFARLDSSSLTDDGVPGLVTLARAARNGERHDDPFAGAALGRTRDSIASEPYEPSPYSDFNGARLLYFASFVSIADTAERRMAHRLGWAQGDDWALATSTVRRDVFYYGNIRLGESVSTHLLAFEWGSAGRFKTHLRVVRDADHRTLADLITEKRVRLDS